MTYHPVLLGGKETNEDGDYRWMSDAEAIGSVVPWKSSATSTVGATVLGIGSFGGNWKYIDLLASDKHYFTCQANLGTRMILTRIVPTK